MNLSTKGRYGTRALIDLAARYGQGPVMLKDISARQQISERYLEQILAPLKAAGLVRVSRGAHGGFALARHPATIRVIDIVQIMEGSTAPTVCVDDAAICPRSGVCVVRDLWSRIKEATDSVLSTTSLEDLVEKQQEADLRAARASNC
ncbi:MAG: Rrf2 family transcriptional regulator [Dehalococcoidia bacterium]|nr:Rrf2 family transcriptional regulator [Dehalococcoidia bacterium]